MKIFLVGGAVRDKLLNYPSSEQDWVVVGATEAEMLSRGFSPVGKDFPVFLHPESKDEYALARKERKVAAGYGGFNFDTDSSITLEQDLLRRDLTINAMAQSSDGQLIDPYGGQRDLQKKILRHVSDAFVEDPLRVLRVARFAARYAHLGFRVAEETMALMQNLVKSGEMQHLVAERSWKESERALGERSPWVYFEILQQCGALAILMPELSANLQQNKLAIAALKKACSLQANQPVRLSALCHQLAPQKIREQLAQLKAPKNYIELASLCSQHQRAIANFQQLCAEEIFALIKQSDALRKSQRFNELLLSAKACVQAQRSSNHNFSSANQLAYAAKLCLSISGRALTNEGLTGPEIGAELERRRLQAIGRLLDSIHSSKVTVTLKPAGADRAE
ncbi:hypothetical protein [Agaribacterium haliotis]|uniref:hypothetical protein n=1 Tax=Agaribacterium haliotis TaxID=2013869 RepID=UPI000BB55EF4|nr:hypothetical protein [Agaribacterium haliotis]